MATLKLTAAQVSALECAGLECQDDVDDYPTIRKAWQGPVLVFDAAERDALFTELTDRSNAEDAAAQETTDPTMRRQATGAAVALGNLASKVLKAVA